MIVRGLGWVLFLTGLGSVVYALRPGAASSYVITATTVFLFAVPLLFLGAVILVFSKE